VRESEDNVTMASATATVDQVSYELLEKTASVDYKQPINMNTVKCQFYQRVWRYISTC